MPALRPLADGGPNPKVDIVAVHGLNPKSKSVKKHAWDTWRKPAGDCGNLWLRDDLPNELPDARIFLYEYDSRAFSDNHQTFLDAANQFLDCLRGKRHKAPRRPLILVGHSLGGLLIKQALVNAHDNSHYEDIEASVKGLAFFGTPHAGGNVESAKVSIGFTAAKIATHLGFSANDSIVQVLTPGSLFGDFLRESFRHQLEKYFIVSFWEMKGTIVAKESATFGLPGHRETILGLEADHSNICKFDREAEDDRDIYEFVANNFRWLYEEAMKETEFAARLDSLQATQPLQRDLEVIETFFESMSMSLDILRNRPFSPQPDDSLDWVIHTSAYNAWSQNLSDNFPVLWCKSDEVYHKATETSIALGHLLLQQGYSIIHLTKDPPDLPDLSLINCPHCTNHLHCTERPLCTKTGPPDCLHPHCLNLPRPHCTDHLFCTKRDVSAQFSMLQQVYMFNPLAGSFSTFVEHLDILIPNPRDRFENQLRQQVTNVFIKLLNQDRNRRWVLLVHDADSLHIATRRAISKLLEELLQGPSETRAQNLKIAILGGEPQMMAFAAQKARVIDTSTEYRECLASLKFDSMNNRRGRITAATVGTNHWIWQNPSYLTWKNKASSIIWIAGKPGSGKSVLAKTMQQQLLAHSGTTRSLIAAWFYSARDNLTLHQQMLSALMYQLLSQEVSLFEHVKHAYRSLLRRHTTYRTISWPIASLKRGMSSILVNLAEKGMSCLFIVDGLDESNPTDTSQDCSRSETLNFLVHLTAKGLPLKIIFLSRFSDDINRCLKNEYYISMHDVNRPDIVFLIEHGVEDLARRLDGDDSDVDDEYSPIVTPTMSPSSSFRMDLTTRRHPVSPSQEYSKQASSEKETMILEIKVYLKANANGVVLWVSTVIDILKRKCEEPFCDLKSLKAQLESLPLELAELYSRIAVLLLQSFKGSRSTLEKSRRVLMWVSVSSQYNFQFQDLLEVMSSDLSSDEPNGKPNVLAARGGWSTVRRQIERLCAAFVEFIPVLPRTDNAADSEPTQWDILQLAHESVRTFLQHDKNSLGLGFSSIEADRVVRKERRNYMRRTLPELTPIFHLSVFQPSIGSGSEQKLCRYIENRPLLCFILSTLEFELQHIMSQRNGHHRIADIINGVPPVNFPFSPANSLLAACDFVRFSKPKNVQLGSKEVAYFVDNATFLGELFFVACTEGQLNAVNVLSLLLVSLTAGGTEEIIIMDAIRRAAREEELTYEVKLLRSGRECVACCPNEMRGRVRRSDRAAAAISQVFQHLKFERTSDRFQSLPSLDSGYMLWTESPHWYRKLHALSKDKSNYYRTAFTRLVWTGADGGYLLSGEGDD